MPVATVVPLGPRPKVLEQARAASGAVALVDGPLDGPDAWSLATAVAVGVPDRPVLIVVDAIRRPPGILAAMAATLDGLSEGRLLLALRGEEADVEEVFIILDRLLRGEKLDHDGPRFYLHGAAVGVRPSRRPRLPLLRAGSSPDAWSEGEVTWLVLPPEAPQVR